MACSGQAQTPTPAPVAQTPTAAPVQLAAAAPVEAPEPTEVPAATSVPTEVPSTATTAPPTKAPAPTAMPAPTAEAEATEPTGTRETDSLMAQLSSDEESCISEAGGTEKFMAVIDTPDLASPQERDAFVNCLEHENLLTIFLKGFTDQTGPLSDDTSACVSTGFRDFDLQAMMLSNPAEGGEESAMIQGMAGLLITISCLNEEEWQAASPTLDLPPDGRESVQCISTMLGGPDGIAASLQSQDGQPPTAFFEAAAECGMNMMGGPPN